MTASFKRLRNTIRDISQYRELFKYLLAFLIYVDGIGTIIGVAAIYGAELGFGSVELVLALLLVQFVGIPYSLIFGRLPSPGEKRRPFYLAFVLFNLVALPVMGIAGSQLLPPEMTGTPPEPFASSVNVVGQGVYPADDDALRFSGTWETTLVSADLLGTDEDAPYSHTSEPDAAYAIPFNGQNVKITHSTGPDHGIWSVELDGEPVIDPDNSEPLLIDGYSPTIRYEVDMPILVDSPGEHVLRVINTGDNDPSSQGTIMTIGRIEVLPPLRQSNLGVILGLIVAVELLGLLFAFLLGKPLFTGLAAQLDTKRSILLALLVYTVIAIWGFFLNSVIEFWCLAWMVAIVQGGSQALSRSLFASLSPAAKSGEFFGLFGIMEKFSAVLGPLIFAFAATNFESSRPAILSLIAFFIVGGYLLTRVNVEEGQRLARAEDARLLGEATAD